MPPLVSILTPFRNTAAFLPHCLESIQQQTYANWELLLVDDHSTDRSMAIVKDIAKSDTRIKLFKNEGQGIIDALRLAFSKSKGEYITRMDSDDVMLPNKLDVLVNNLQNHGKKHVAIGLVKYISDDTISEGYRAYETWLNELTKEGKNFEAIYKECSIPSPCWMMHKEDLLLCRAFDEDRYPEDYDLTFRCYEQQIKCIPCEEVIHLWREYKTRTSRTHKHYTLPYFLDIKLHYFLKLDRDENRELCVWGVGNKGKHIAKHLLTKNLDFYWISANPKKIGKTIEGINILNFNEIGSLKYAQHIITFSNTSSQQKVTSLFKDNELEAQKDYFFFC